MPPVNRKDRIRLQLGLLPQVGSFGLLDAPRSSQAAPPAPSPPPMPPSAPQGNGGGFLGKVGDAVGQVFGGADDPRLSGEQNAMARKQAMIQAGLATMGAAGQGMDAFGAIAAGGMAGQEAGMGLRERAYAMTSQERLTKALQDPRLMSLFNEQEQMLLAVLPPADAVKMIQAKLQPKDQIAVADGTQIYDPTTRTMVYENKADPKDEPLPAELRAAIWGMNMDPETLTPEDRKIAMEEYAKLKKAGASNTTIMTPRQEFADVNTLAGEYRRDIATHQIVAEAYGVIRAIAQNPSAASDIALVYQFMKMQDPGSTVREGEYAKAEDARGVPETVRNLYNKLTTGEFLTAGQRADFVNQARKIAQTRQVMLQPTMKRYRMRAGLVGMVPEMVVFDPFIDVDPGIADPAVNPFTVPPKR